MVLFLFLFPWKSRQDCFISFLGAVAIKHLEIWGSFLCVTLGTLLCSSWLLIWTSFHLSPSLRALRVDSRLLCYILCVMGWLHVNKTICYHQKKQVLFNYFSILMLFFAFRAKVFPSQSLNFEKFFMAVDNFGESDLFSQWFLKGWAYTMYIYLWLLDKIHFLSLG